MSGVVSEGPNPVGSEIELYGTFSGVPVPFSGPLLYLTDETVFPTPWSQPRMERPRVKGVTILHRCLRVDTRGRSELVET